jgi:membrane-associated phospholipid phosphatase
VPKKPTQPNPLVLPTIIDPRTVEARLTALDPRARLARLPQAPHGVSWSLVGIVLILLVGFMAKWAPGFAQSELVVDQVLSRHEDEPLTALALGINVVLSPPGIVIILVASFLFLLLVRRAPVNAFAFVTVAGIGWLSSEFFKLVVAMPRPNGHLLQHPLLAESGQDSFPSGHTTFAVAFAIAVYFLAHETRWRRFAAVGGVLFVFAVGASRVYAGAHYPSDVLGSVLVGASIIGIYTAIWNRYGLRVLNRFAVLRRIGPVPRADL